MLPNGNVIMVKITEYELTKPVFTCCSTKPIRIFLKSFIEINGVIEASQKNYPWSIRTVSITPYLGPKNYAI